MLYYLFEFIEQNYQMPGASLFSFLSFRSALAIHNSTHFNNSLDGVYWVCRRFHQSKKMR